MKTHAMRLLIVMSCLLAVLLTIEALAAGAAPTRPVTFDDAISQPESDALALAKIEPGLLKELAENGSATYIVYLHDKADFGLAQMQPDALSRRQAIVKSLQETAWGSQAALLAFLDRQTSAGHVKQATPYWIFNGVAVMGDRDTLLALAARGDVERIQANHVRRLDAQAEIVSDAQPPDISASTAAVEWNVARVRANEVWNVLGLTGQGVVVANLDTGVYYQHPALARQYRGFSANGIDHNYNWYDVTNTYPAAPDDGNGHGTHTMGTIAGADSSGTSQIGVAPGVRWIAVKVFDDAGNTTDAQIHSALQWVIAPTNLQGQNPDPAKAPDIVSNSWGDTASSDQTFWQDVLALRSAGILTVFAGGNAGPASGSVDSPASYPQSFAVGATTSDDVVAGFSGRGPSPWGEIKPDIVAPGVNIRSALPPVRSSTGYGYMSGTSMATPHAAGVAALLLQGQPSLTVTATEFVLTSTVAPLPNRSLSPNNNYGWGLLDAYQAAASLASGGRIWGRVIGGDAGLPIAGASLAAQRQDGTGNVRTTTDLQGYYTLTVGGGLYQMTVASWWYETASVSDVEITAGYTTVRDFSLTRRPSGRLSGRISVDGAPITATVSISSALDQFQLGVAVSTSGVYSAVLPVGVYELQVRPATGYRQGHARVVIGTDMETVQDFALAASPRILLVDADRWSGATHIGRYQLDLDSLLLSYDTWSVISLTTGLPPTATLSAYDLVIWDHASTSPGYVGAWTRLGSYLDSGGRLLLIGQDIGYWDIAYGYGAAAYRAYLHAQFVRDDAGFRSVSGVAGDIFGGITLTMNTPDSAASLGDARPDAISAADAGATSILSYTAAITTGGCAGLKIETALYRAVYLPFALQGTGLQPARVQAVNQALTWLTMPSLRKTADPGATSPGQVVTFTLTLRNSASSAAPGLTMSDALPATLSYVEGSGTGGLVYIAAQRQLEWRGDIAPGATLTFTFQARLGRDVPVQTTVVNTAYVSAPSGASFPASASVTVDMPDLSASLMAGRVGMWQTNQEITYTVWLTNSGQAGAMAAVQSTLPPGLSYASGSGSSGVTYAAASQRVAWEGWIAPAGPPLANYVHVTSDQPGGPAFDWIDLTSTGTRVPTGDDTMSGPYDIGFPFPFFGGSRTQVWISSNGWLSFRSSAHSAYSNQCLPSSQALPLALAAWWDDLNPGLADQGIYVWSNHRDMLVVSFVGVPSYSNDGAYTFQTILRADGTITYQYLTMAGSALQAGTIGIQDDAAVRAVTIACNESFVRDRLALRLSPPGPSASATSFSYRARVDDGLPFYATITSTALLSSGDVSYTLVTTNQVNIVDLSASAAAVDKSIAGPGDTLFYSMAVRNTGTATTTAFLRDVLPESTVYVPGSASAGASYNAASRAILWNGLVAPHGAAVVSFAATLAPGLASGSLITNSVVMTDVLGRSYTRAASTAFFASDLSPSRMDASAANAGAGQMVTLTITVANSGGGPTDFTVTDTLPLGLRLLPGTMDVAHGTGVYDEATRRVLWHGRILSGYQTYLRFAVRVEGSADVVNMARIRDGSGLVIERSASLRFLPYRLFFGAILVHNH